MRPIGEYDPINDPPPREPVGHPDRGSGGDVRPATIAQQGKPIPIVYGTAKVPLLLVERYAAAVASNDVAHEVTAYTVGESLQVSWTGGTPAGVHSLKVTVAGTTGGSSSANPLTNVAAKIAWDLVTTPMWTLGAAYAAGDVVINIQARRYVCTSPIASATTMPMDYNVLSITDGSGTWAHGTWVSGSCAFEWQQSGAVLQNRQAFVGALAEGEIAGGGQYLWWDQEVIYAPSVGNSPGRTMTVTTGPDALSQTLPALFATFAYQHTALLYGSAVPTDQQKELPACAVEIRGVLFGGAGPDVNPADILNDILTHSRRGCSWPGGRVDSSITGTAASGYRVYCDALGLRLSWVIDTQRTALSLVGDLLTATNSDAVWSGGKLKVVPLGDQATTSPVFGATNYSPSVAAVYNLTPDDFLSPVEVERRSEADCFNSYPVEYTNRGAYQRTTVEDPDTADVDVRGAIVRGSPVALPFVFPDGQRPVMISRIAAQRSANNRNTYRFKLSWRFVLLEPCDVVTLTDTVLGLSLTPVRITELAEDGDGLAITAEDYPAGVAASGTYAPQLNEGFRVNRASSVATVPVSVDGSTVTLAPEVVTGAAIAASSVTAAKIAAGTITANEIAGGTITAAKIAAGTITATEIAAGAIKTSNYAETSHTAWAPSTVYVFNAKRTNGGNLYVATSGTGTSAASGGPTGTGLAITDGGVTWAYVGAAFDYATAGAKLDHTGTALSVAAGNMRLGTVLMQSMIAVYSVSITAGNSTGTASFSTAQIDLTYTAHAMMTGITGATAVAGNAEIIACNNGFTSFTFTIRTAIPAGGTATYTVAVMRAP